MSSPLATPEAPVRVAPLNFTQRLQRAVDATASNLCVGLDPDTARMPAGFADDPEDVLRFVLAIVEATAEFAAAYKPNSAFYEILGAPGLEVLAAVIAAVPADIPVILDAKRGDIGNTAERYASAAFETLGAAAITVSPYLGWDSIAPFANRPDRGAFVLCRTSNPGASDIQDLRVGERPLYLEVAGMVRDHDEHRNLGLVAGATSPGDIVAIRQDCPGIPILVPGVGAQGGDVSAAARAAAGDERDLFLVSSSRGVMHASAGVDFQHAAGDAARALRDQVSSALGARS